VFATLHKSYDFVIVGAGAAGCVLAARLSENPRHRVLLLEAGGADSSPLIHAPGAMFVMLRRGLYAWAYQTEPQTQLDGRVLFDVRGKVLGGSTSINGMQYCRGSPRDYDHWAELGNEGWSYSDVLPYFKRSERSSRGASPLRGESGPLTVTRAEIRHPIAQAWLDAAVQAGYSYNDDTNGVAREGFGPQDEMLFRGRRVSAARAYLAPARGRRNLVVATRATAQRLLLSGRRCAGVEYLQHGMSQRVEADRAVIVAAGVFGSPQLLMLSGIGNPPELESHGIAPRVGLPGVGRNFRDHVGFWVSVTCRKPITDLRYMTVAGGIGAVLRHYALRSGPLSESPVRAIGLVRSELAEPGWPDLKFQCVTALIEGPDMRVERHGFLARVAMTRPASTGSVTLRSADPQVTPRIDARYFAAPEDLARARAGVRIARDIFAQRALDPFRGVEVSPGAQVETEQQIDAWLRATAGPDLHGVGTCRMGIDAEAVVDSRLRVHGVDNLRVVDASIMPDIVSGNTAAPTIMIGEKGADMILAE
jgi:choline dehydrogenase